MSALSLICISMLTVHSVFGDNLNLFSNDRHPVVATVRRDSPLPAVPDFADLTLPEDEPVDIEMISHHPCERRPTSFETLRFSDHRTAPMIESTTQPGCFVMKGPVTIFKDFDPDVEIYVQMKTDPKPNARPLKCENKQDGKGAIGSCVYDQPCDLEQKHKDTVTTSKVKVTRTNGAPLKCDEPLKAGSYDDIELHFCPPTKMQLAEMSQSSLMKDIEKQAAKLNSNDVKVFLRIYVFDQGLQLAALKAKDPRIETWRRDYQKIPENETSPHELWSQLPFERFIQNTESFLACHVVVGKVKLMEDVQ